MAVPTGTHTATVSLGYVNTADGKSIYYLGSYYNDSCYSFYKGPVRWMALQLYPTSSFLVNPAGVMFKSLDDGATWSLTGGLSPEVSTGGVTSPAYDVGFAAFDDIGLDPNAASKITAIGNASSGGLGHFAGFFTDFDFASETWSAAYGAVDYPTLDDGSIPVPSSTPSGGFAHAVIDAGGTPPYIISGASVAGSSPWMVIDAAGNAHLGNDPGGHFTIAYPHSGNVRIHGGSLIFAQSNLTSGHMEVLSRPVASGAWTVETVSILDGLYDIHQPPWMSSATDLFFIGTGQNSIYLTQKTGGVWGAPVQIWSYATDTNPDVVGDSSAPPRIWQLIASCNPVLDGLDISFEFDGLVIDAMVTFHLPPTGAGWSTLVGGCSDAGGIAISCNDPPDGALGDPYSHPLTILGAPAGSTVSITGGALPPGLTIDSAGVISGTPTLGGSYTYTATVTPPALLRSGRSGSSATLSTSEGYDLGTSAFAVPGIEYAGNQFLFVKEGGQFLVGDNGVHILKSTDNGATWSEVAMFLINCSRGGATTTDNSSPSYTVCQDGGTAYILYTDGVGPFNSNISIGVSTLISGPLYKRTFDLATNALSGEVDTGFTGVYKNNFGSAAFVHLVRRGPGDFFFVYSSLPEIISSNLWFRISIASYNGSTFGTPAMIPGQAGNLDTYKQATAGVDETGILHVIFWKQGVLRHMHSGFSSSTGFGTSSIVGTAVGYTEKTSRLISSGGSIYFAACGTQFTYDKTIYHATGGTTNPTWDLHNIDTFSPVIDNGTGESPGNPFALAYLDGNLHLFWTRSGSEPDDWDTRLGMGVIQHSQAAITDLATWTPEDTIIANPGPPENKWAAAQVEVYAGPLIGLGIFGGFTGVSTITDDPIENGQFFSIPPEGSGIEPASVTCSMNVGYGDLSTSCGAPPAYTVGVAGAAYRPPIVMGAIGLPPVYDQNGTLVWTFPVVPPPGFHWETNPASDNYGYLVGTPTVSGVQSFTYTVSTPDGQSITNTCPLDVAPADDGGGGGGGDGDGGIEITCANPPGGKVGVPYSHTFPVMGATGPTRYSVVVGALPPGVHLDPATGDLSGTPTAPGTYSFSIKVQQ